MENLLEIWKSIFLFDFLRYFIPASLAFLLFWVIGRKHFQLFLIQKSFPKNAQLFKEFAYSMSTVLIFSLIGLGIVFVERAAYTRIYSSIWEFGIPYLILSLSICIIFHDFYFYWTHRLMHHKVVFKWVHKVHHQSINPSPWAAYSFHPLEAVIQAAVLPILIVTLPLHSLTIFIFLTYMILRNVLGHLSIEVLPKGFTKNKWLNWNTSITHHNLHHKNFNCNYGLYFSWWDKLLKTEDKRYHDTFEEVKSRTREIEKDFMGSNIAYTQKKRNMNRAFKFIAVLFSGVMSYILVGASCLPNTAIPASGLLFGRSYTTTVDNLLAKEILSNPTSKDVRAFFSLYANRPLNTVTLSEISDKYSMDVSTLYFLNRVYNNPRNNHAQDLYLNYIDQLSDKFKNELEPLQHYYIAFVPGLDYLNTTNGGDFAKQRRLLSQNGIRNELILTKSWGLCEENAKIIANRIVELNSQYENIILVSASKGGLDVAIAMGKLLMEEDIPSVKAWVSVGGILKGSPVADKYLIWPRSWIAKMGLLFVWQKFSLIQDLSYKKRAKEYENLRFPKHVKTIHFVGAPLSTQIHSRIRSNHCLIKEFGPNDGITPLADEISKEGIVISELGLDHYYKHPEIDKKTIALALTVISIPNHQQDE